MHRRKWKRYQRYTEIPTPVKEANEYLAEIIEKVNDLFQGELTDQDKRVYVNNAIKAKLMESATLKEQPINNTKQQFANSPDLKSELMKAILGALDAHNVMSSQALGSEALRDRLKNVLLHHAGLYESLRETRPPDGP